MRNNFRHLKIINLDDNQKLWRYMDLSKFVSILRTKSLWLSRADSFNDKQEGRIPDDMKESINKAFNSLPSSDNSPVKTSDDFQDYLVKNTYISCWHKNVDENMAMWEIYGRQKESIAVKTTVKNIRESIDPSTIKGFSLIMKDVDYKNADEIIGEIQYGECFFRKRRHYQYEKEVRICLDTYNAQKPMKNTQKGHKLHCHLNTLIENVIVHPDCNDWFLKVVSSICNKYEISATVNKGEYGNE